MEEVNRRNREAGYPPVAMGIGINTGHVIVGNIGSKKRTKYAVVGRNVNLTSRIESYTLGGQILISGSTLDQCGPILRVDDQMEVMPKGVREPITIYQIGGMNGKYDIALPPVEKRELLELKKALGVRFSVLSGKHAGTDSHCGYLTGLRGDAARIQAELVPDRLENLRITLLDEDGSEVTPDLYGKVVACGPAPISGFTVSLTSIPPEGEVFFRKVLASCKKG